MLLTRNVKYDKVEHIIYQNVKDIEKTICLVLFNKRAIWEWI